MLTVLMPSRGRTAQARDAYAAFLATKTLPDTTMLIVLDAGEQGYEGLPVLHIDPADSGHGMGPALNAALSYAKPGIVGFAGDDHRFRTTGWDARITVSNAAMGGGITYGNDLIRGEELPSQVFMDTRIVKTLGWMALPGARHLYLDDTWRELGRAMGRLSYLADVEIEHLHPTAGKADWDDNYLRVNDPAIYDHDGTLYRLWLSTQCRSDAMRAVEALR